MGDKEACLSETLKIRNNEVLDKINNLKKEVLKEFYELPHRILGELFFDSIIIELYDTFEDRDGYHSKYSTIRYGLLESKKKELKKYNKYESFRYPLDKDSIYFSNYLLNDEDMLSQKELDIINAYEKLHSQLYNIISDDLLVKSEVRRLVFKKDTVGHIDSDKKVK